MARWTRVALLTYPREFRGEQGTEWVRTVRDLRVHGGLSRAQVAGVVAGDLLMTAPRMRWEYLRGATKLVLGVAIGSVGLVALVMGSTAITLLLVSLSLLVALQSAGQDRPIGPAPQALVQRWYVWFAGAAVAFAVGSIPVLADGDDELNSAQWLVWVLSWAVGSVLVIIGLSLGVKHLVVTRR